MYVPTHCVIFVSSFVIFVYLYEILMKLNIYFCRTNNMFRYLSILTIHCNAFYKYSKFKTLIYTRIYNYHITHLNTYLQIITIVLKNVF